MRESQLGTSSGHCKGIGVEIMATQDENTIVTFTQRHCHHVYILGWRLHLTAFDDHARMWRPVIEIQPRTYMYREKTKMTQPSCNTIDETNVNVTDVQSVN